MSEFVCKKPITLSGRNFSYGEVIPEGYVLPGRALALIRSNYIAEIEGGPTEEKGVPITPIQGENGDTLITIPIEANEGILEATMSSQSVITFFTINQKNAEDAKNAIGNLDDSNALLLLSVFDTRKTVKDAATERAKKINVDSNPEEEKKGDA